MSYIIILDDEINFAISYKEMLEDEGYKVDIALTINEFYTYFLREKPDLIILDVDLKKDGNNGIDFLSELNKQEDFYSKVIVITGKGGREECARAIKLGAYSLFDKHQILNIDTFKLAVKQALNLKNQEDYSRYLENQNNLMRMSVNSPMPLIGDSKPMLELKEQIKKLAKTNVSVLIEGETGTGKEVVANHLFWNSRQSKGSMITVDLSSIPESLFESELFGHVKGAFTGSHKTKKGYIEKAENSVLFWDEIENVNFLLQAKILRVIENKEIQVLGGDKKKINTIFYFATNKNLFELVKAGEFREDLYYRLEKFCLKIPPLRDRGEDIILLLDFFFQKYKKRFNNTFDLDFKKLHPYLMKYKWYGNVRELSNFCEYLLYQRQHIDNEIIIEEIKKKIEKNSCHEFQAETIEIHQCKNYQDTMSVLEKKYLLGCLSKNNYDVVKTAVDININPSSLYRKIKKLKITCSRKQDGLI